MKWVVAAVVLFIVLPIVYADSDLEQSAICESLFSCGVFNYTYESDGCIAFSGTVFSISPFNSRYEGYSEWIIYNHTYFFGYPSISYNCSGVATVYYDSFPDNDDIPGWPDCNRYGCFGGIIPSSGTLVIAHPGETMRNVWVQCWDGSESRCILDNGDNVSSYSWSWQGFNMNNSLNVVSCAWDSNCDNGLICDNSGPWQEWSCVSRETAILDIPEMMLMSKEIVLFDVPIMSYSSSTSTTEEAAYKVPDVISVAIDFIGTALSSFTSIISLLSIGVALFCIYYIIRNFL